MSQQIHHLEQPVNGLLFFYLSTANIIPHTGSTLTALFAVAGIVLYFRSHPRIVITKPERWVLGTFVFFSAIYLLSFAINNFMGNLPDFKLKFIDDEMRMLLVLPVFYLFRTITIYESAIWNGIVTGAITSGIYAIGFFVVTDGQRVSGSYDAIAFGNLSLLMAVLSVPAYDVLIKKNGVYKWVVATALILGLIAAVLSGSRGTWASIPLLFVILFFFTSKYIHLKGRILILGLCCLFGTVSYFIPAINVDKRVDSAFSEISDYFQGNVHYGGATVRLLGLQASVKIFLDHPWIGTGPGSYNHKVNQMIAQDELHAMTAQHNEPSSTIFATMVACGSLGLIGLSGLFISPFWLSITLLRKHCLCRNAAYGLMMVSVAFFHFGMSEIIFRRSFFSNLYIIMIAVFMALIEDSDET